MFLKKILLCVLVITSSYIALAQSPLQFNYQAIARNTNGVPLANQDVTLRFSIRNESVNGPVEYMEIRKLQTNQFGMFTVGIGSDGPFFTSGSLTDVKWETGRKFLQVEMDYTGGNNYVDLGATQLVSVPYALFALRSLEGGAQSTFAGAGANGLSVQDSTIAFGNSKGQSTATLKDDRYIPLNGKSLNFSDGNSLVRIQKNLLSFDLDSLGGADGATGAEFLRSNPIFPREDAVPFAFSRVAVQQHNGSVSPNEVVIWGHNINKGGGPAIAGLPGIGYSLESNFKPKVTDRWVESHEFYITPQGQQIRLKSYTIDTKTDWVDFYHSTDNLYLKNPRTGDVYFRIDNNNADNVQMSLGLWRLDVNNANKQMQFQSSIPDAELYMNANWKRLYFPGLTLQSGDVHLLSSSMVSLTDKGVSLGSISNRFSAVNSIAFKGENLMLKNGWAQYDSEAPTSTLDVEGQSGFNQLRLRKSYTPTSSTDANGAVGDLAWDENFMYIKTANGWKRTKLENF